MVAFDKPTGLLSVPGIGPEKADCLASRAENAISGTRIVHRLDRDTSGVIVLARDADTHRELSRQFHDRETDKTYFAVVAGTVLGEEGLIDAPLRKDLDRPPRHLVDQVQGKSAQTRWCVEARGCAPERTLLKFEPHTGRTHQLRIHACVLGHPILGDDLYAPPETVQAADRLMLHAAELVVTHPRSGERIQLVAPVPFAL
ncbi:MAG: RNA pseudouridine synthase [Planctomycetes bacterium TMED75]|nr:RNA pseudouridine synthase [Planctomycetaceae bacterium]OUU92707.1 MAG: RNA pseudouridine synthase [Planctomycetes bacterium TMED75]